jgi:hypothetical protein
VVAADGSGTARPVESGRGQVFSAHFSIDGRWAAYGLTSNGETNVFIAGVPGASGAGEGPGPRRIQVSSHGGMLPQWGAGDRELVYVRGDGMIVSVPLAAGTMEPGAEKELFRVVLRPGTASFDMSADGQRFAVDTLASEGAAPIVVLTNWKRALVQR